MKKQDILNLYNKLHSLGGLAGVKFAYAVSKNIKTLQSEIDLLEKVIASSKEFIETEDLRIKLAESFAKKDEAGKPKKVMEGKVEKYEMEDENAFSEAFNKFREEHKEVYEAREKQLKEYTELLETETEVSLHTIPFEEVPKNITVAQLHGISEIVNAPEQVK